MLDYNPQIYINCPECNGQPEVQLALYGQGYFTICGLCSWEGNTRDIEPSPDSALWHWSHKVINYKLNKIDN